MTSPNPTDAAYQIWMHTRAAVTEARYPARLSYDIAITGLDGEQFVINHYVASCDPDTGAIRVFPISEEQLAQPAPVPRGVNTYFTIRISNGGGAPALIVVPMGHPVATFDLLGDPILSPTYMFGIPFHAKSVSPQTTANSNAPTVIADVSSTLPQYRVTLLDSPTVDDVSTYHLMLTPLRDPKVNRLRELWVGVNDSLPRQAIIAGNFTAPPLVDVTWKITFAVVDAVPYVSSETAASTLFLPHRRVVRDAVVSFVGVREASGSLYGQPLTRPDIDDTSLIEPEILVEAMSRRTQLEGFVCGELFAHNILPCELPLDSPVS